MSAVSLAILFALVIAAPVLIRANARVGTVLVAAVPFGLGCWFASVLGRVGSGEVILSSIPWIEELGVSLSFRVDGLSLVFALLICFIGSAVLLFASSDLRESDRLGSFCSTIVGFMAAMLGLVLAENLILVFIFWELTSITSFLLIGFDHERESARKAALQALLVTGLGGLALLAGLVLLGLASKGFEVRHVLEADLHAHPFYVAIVALVLLGAFTKSAIFPFHFWLPNAMEAPSPVSALLHSATMVKAGVYIIARLNPAMGGTEVWGQTLTIAGGATMLIAVYLATRQGQIKKILAYSTVSSLGTLVMLIGMGAGKAASVYLIGHALFKGALFLVAGTVTGQTGEKYPEKLGGLRRRMPWTAMGAAFAALSMAGLFPLIGFVGKELLLKAGLSHPEWAGGVTVATVIAGTLTVMVALLVGYRPFFGALPEAHAETREADWRQLFGPLALAGGGVVAGVAPWIFAEPLVGAMIMSIEGAAPEHIDLRPLHLLWPATTATVLSFVALGLGTGLYMVRKAYRRIGDGPARLEPYGPERWYAGTLKGLFATASAQTRVLQNGSLQTYVRVTLLIVFAIGALALVRSNAWRTLAPALGGLNLLDAILILVLISAAVAATMQRTALASVAVLGAVGFSLALLYALYGAPDVAMTQFAVETLVVIIFVLVLFHLPRYSAFTSRARRVADWCFAGAVGVLMSALTLIVASRASPESISVFYAERAYLDAYGRNVVNVILVDFRALDTLGEIFVIGIAAVGVYTLLQLRARPGEGVVS